jgi:hypothetical protein
MKKEKTNKNGELKPEYDLKGLKVRKLGPGRKRFGQTSIETGEDREYASGDRSEDTLDESDVC